MMVPAALPPSRRLPVQVFLRRGLQMRRIVALPALNYHFQGNYLPAANDGSVGTGSRKPGVRTPDMFVAFSRSCAFSDRTE